MRNMRKTVRILPYLQIKHKSLRKKSCDQSSVEGREELLYVKDYACGPHPRSVCLYVCMCVCVCVYSSRCMSLCICVRREQRAKTQTDTLERSATYRPYEQITRTYDSDARCLISFRVCRVSSTPLEHDIHTYTRVPCSGLPFQFVVV